jgi:hypothetical protein
LVHVGVFVSLVAWSGTPVHAEHGGQGALDAGGDNAGEFAEDEAFNASIADTTGRATLYAIAVLVDAPVAAPKPVVAPEVESVAPAPVLPVVPVKIKKVAEALPEAPMERELAELDSPQVPVSGDEFETEAGSTAAVVVAEPVAVADPAAAVVHRASKNRKPSGKGKSEPCPVVADDGVERLGDHAWSVERDVAEYYAGHLRELNKLVSVRLVKNEAGKPDGFRVGVPRCSLLREGGLRSGDVVKDVNGIRVHDVFTAIAAYLKLRREDTIVLNVVRKGKPMTLRYTLV